MTDIFGLQDEITSNVVAAIQPHLYVEEGVRASNQPPEQITTWGLTVRAIVLINKVGRKENEEARSLLERAIRMEPSYATAHAILGWGVWWAAYNWWLSDKEKGIEEARQHAEDALALDPNEPWGRMVLGALLAEAGQYAPALRELEDTLHLNPSFALAYAIHGWALAVAGNAEAAIEESNKAFRLSPSDAYVSLYEFYHGFALFTVGRYSEAAHHARRAMVAFPEFPAHHGLLISCYGHLGLTEDVKRLLAHRNRLPGPPLTLRLVRKGVRLYAARNALVEGMSKAGVPES